MSPLQLALCLLIKCSIAIQLPCDIFASGSTPCVAAHSTVRALFSTFNGSLYQVKRSSDNNTLNISVISTGGYADAASQDKFCQHTNCIIQRIYDQSSQNNHLDIAPPGGNAEHYDKAVNASRQPLTVDNQQNGTTKVYAAYFEGGMGYRIDKTSGVAIGNEAEVIYMVTSGKHYNSGCCFDYGNAETDNHDDGKGTMEALNFGNNTRSNGGHGEGNGPWVMVDLENGLWAGNSTTVQKGNTPLTSDFVFAMVKGGTNGFALKGGDVNNGLLKTMYDGPRPSGYQPMRKQGSIILSIGGDNSDWAKGTFFEGAMIKGYTNNDIDTAVYNNVVSVKYKL